MIVLGLHRGHESGAAVVKDGKILADVAEERFARVKHCNNTPIECIKFCLAKAGLSSINEFDLIVYSGKSTPDNLRSLLGLKVPKGRLIREIAKKFVGSQSRLSKIKPPIYFPDFRLKDETKIINIQHHLAHASSAYFTRKSRDRCLIFTIDGAGDMVSVATWLGEGNTISLEETHSHEASIGWSYSAVTEGLGWWHGDGEGTLMGLAPYGDHSKCAGVLDKYFPSFNGHRLLKPAELGPVTHWNEGGYTHFHLDEAYEIEKLAKRYGRENIAAEAQRKLEDCLMNYIFGWCKCKGIKKIACAGGVFLNVKLNQRVWNNRQDIIEEQHIFPNAGDSGLAVGAALYGYYKHNEFVGSDFSHLYLGPEYANEDIRKLLDSRALPYKYVENPARRAAELLAENKVVAWFQGPMESGPRALGNRSILMSPLKAENKDLINGKVKFREAFRPFCPSLLWERRNDYLLDVRDEYFMITSFDVNPSKADKIPAVVHVDGTVRPQMVKRDVNPIYWDLINNFGELTGEYIILNTSFNIKGEPVINNPREAIRCFYDTGIDVLFLGNFMLEKDCIR
jgi:carbamoyltransferase